MAVINIMISSSRDSVAELISKIYRGPGCLTENVNHSIEYMGGILSGANPATVQITIRDTDPSVSTHGTGSVQVSETKS